MLPGDALRDDISKTMAPLIKQGYEDMSAEEVPSTSIVIEKSLDMRYRGQSYELTIPFDDQFIMGFHNAHQRLYGTSRDDADVEIVNIRVRVSGRGKPPPIAHHQLSSPDATTAYIDTRTVWFPSGPASVPCYRGELLDSGNIISGPAVIVRTDTTILVGPSDHANVDCFHNLLIEIGR